jgi:hypothetical protein
MRPPSPKTCVLPSRHQRGDGEGPLFMAQAGEDAICREGMGGLWHLRDDLSSGESGGGRRSFGVTE